MTDIYDISNTDDMPIDPKTRNYETRARVLELVQDAKTHDSLSPAQIRAAYYRTYNRDLTSNYVQVILNRLVESKELTRPSRGQYSAKKGKK